MNMDPTTVALNQAIQTGIDRVNEIILEAQTLFTKQRIPKEVWMAFPSQSPTYLGLFKLKGEWHIGLRLQHEEDDEVIPFRSLSMVDRVGIIHQLPALRDEIQKQKAGFITELKDAITKGEQFLSSFPPQ